MLKLMNENEITVKKKKKSTLTDWALKNVFTVKLNAATSQDCTKNVARSHKWSG